MEGGIQVTGGLQVISMVQLPYDEYVWMKQTVTELLNFRDEWQAAQAAGGSDHLTRKQAMAYLQVGSTTLWELVQNKEIAQAKVGTKVLYPIASCRAYLKRQTSDPVAAAYRVQAVIDSRTGSDRKK